MPPRRSRSGPLPRLTGLVEDRHPGVHAGFDDEREAVEVPLRHLHGRARQRRHDRRHDDAVHLTRGELTVLEQLQHPHAHLVCGSLPLGGQTPALQQAVVAEHADDDVGVTNIESEEHGETQSLATLRSCEPPAGSWHLSLIHISEPTRLGMISYAVFCLKKKQKKRHKSSQPCQLSKTTIHTNKQEIY